MPPSNEAKTRADGFSFIRRGMDSGSQPVLVPIDGMCFAINVAFRSGSPTTRPGITKRFLDFESEETQAAFEDGFWQGAGSYVWRSTDGGDQSLLMCSIGGRIYTIDIGGFGVADITLASDPNPAYQPQVWFEQGEMFTFIQDNQSRPLIFNGSALRRSNIEAHELPIGNIMCYAQGRMTVVLPDRRSFVAGNLVGSTEGGTPAYNFRDSIISFTENNYLNGGGVFAAPDRINAIREIATLDSTLNQGPIQIFTDNGAYSANFPFLREEWFEVSYPLVTGSLLSRGALSQNSTINVNNDIWFRSSDGIRSFWVARRDSQSWANLPLSYEASRILKYDTPILLEYASAALFDNRYLMTVSPLIIAERGVIHRGLVALDYQEASTLFQDGVPSYDGLWTGLRILQILSIETESDPRCFIFALDPEDKISLYEVTKDAKFDNYGLYDGGESIQSRIASVLETPAYSFGDIQGGYIHTLKELMGGEIAVSELNGNGNFAVQWRNNKNPQWTDWHSWQECATQTCQSVFCLEEQNSPQYRDPVLLPKPPQSDCDPSYPAIGNTTMGFTYQARISFTGPARIDLFQLQADFKKTPALPLPCEDCVPRSLTNCEPPWFNYQIP